MNKTKHLRSSVFEFTHHILLLFYCLIFSLTAEAGIYPPQATLTGTTAIPANSPAIVAWASGYSGYSAIGSNSECERGSDTSSQFEIPEKAFGPAGNSDGNNIDFSTDVVSLGRGGCIDLTFDLPIANGDGWDFAVFENGFFVTLPQLGFLELAWVEVSSDGINYFRFPSSVDASNPVSSFSNVMDASNYDGLAGKYIAGFGVPFDLTDIADNTLLNKSAVTHVRLRDIIGDGSAFDSNSPANVIYDPYPTALSAGFDLDAIAVLNQGQATQELEVPIPGLITFILATLLISTALKRFASINTNTY